MAEFIYGQSSKSARLATHPSSRTCSEGGCSTTLSIYNPSAYCWLHEPLTPRSRFSPKRRLTR